MTTTNIHIEAAKALKNQRETELTKLTNQTPANNSTIAVNAYVASVVSAQNNLISAKGYLNILVKNECTKESES